MVHVSDFREIGVLNPAGVKYLPALHNVQTGYEVHLTCIMRKGVCFLGGKGA
jgi:hypothetical protein